MTVQNVEIDEEKGCGGQWGRNAIPDGRSGEYKRATARSGSHKLWPAGGALYMPVQCAPHRRLVSYPTPSPSPHNSYPPPPHKLVSQAQITPLVRYIALLH